MRKFFLSLLVLALLAVAIVPASAQTGGDTIADIVVASAADGEFTTLLAAVQAAGLVETLAGPGPFTVFAPTDAAFESSLPAGFSVPELLDNPELLTQVLLYHVVPGEFPASAVVTLNRVNVDTAAGLPVFVETRDEGVFLNVTTQVIATDVEASNGVIHVIDEVLLPPYATNADDLYVILGDTPVLAEAGSTAAGGTLNRCQTFFFTDYDRGFARLAGINGWVDTRLIFDVAETYGQPGGQEKLPGC